MALRMLGLTVVGREHLPELPGVPDVADVGRVLRLRETGDPPPAARERWRSPGASPVLVVSETEGGDWSLVLQGEGRAVLRADGGEARLTAAATATDAWPWFVMRQVVAFAAVLQGLEVLHASAVVHDGGGIAITAPSGMGKSTLAAHLIGAGARFLTDDAMALEIVHGTVMAHPGSPVMNVPDTAADSASAALGATLLRDEGSAHRLVTSPCVDAVPLRRLALLEHAGPLEGTSLAREVSPAALLGATMNAIVSTPERLIRLLELHALLVDRAQVVSIGPDDDVASTLAVVRLDLVGSAVSAAPMSRSGGENRR